MNKKCEFRKMDGQRCGADAQSGKTLCVFHDPAKAAAGRRARRLGGINRSRATAILSSETPDNPLRNIQDVSVLLGESINQVRRGQLDPRVANAVGYLASGQVKCIAFWMDALVAEGLSVRRWSEEDGAYRYWSKKHAPQPRTSKRKSVLQ